MRLGIVKQRILETELKKIDLISEELRTRYFTVIAILYSLMIAIIAAMLTFGLTELTSSQTYPPITYAGLGLVVLGFGAVALFTRRIQGGYKEQVSALDDLVELVRHGQRLGEVKDEVHRILTRQGTRSSSGERFPHLPQRADSWIQTAIQTAFIIVTIWLALQQIGLSQPFQYAPSGGGIYSHNTSASSLASVDIRGYRNVIVYVDAHVVFPQFKCGDKVYGFPPYAGPGPLQLQESVDSGNTVAVSNSTGNTCTGLVRFPPLSISQLGSDLEISGSCLRPSACNESISFAFTSLLIR